MSAFDRTLSRAPGRQGSGTTDAVVPQAHKPLPPLPAVLLESAVVDLAPDSIPSVGERAIAWKLLSQADVTGMLAAQGGNNEDLFVRIAQEKGLLSGQQIRALLDAPSVDVYIEPRYTTHPALIGWMQDVRLAGWFCRVFPRSVQELAKLREIGVGAKSDLDEADLSTLAAARHLLVAGAAMQASDLHILVREGFAEIQYRVKGQIKTAKQVRRAEGENIIRAMYTGLSTVKEAVYNPYEFQDAQIAGSDIPGAGLSSVRIIRGPAYPVEVGGSFLVARLQYFRGGGKSEKLSERRPFDLVTPVRPSGEFRLAAMGYTPLQIAKMERMIRTPSGVVVISGPTGSGKTTTLFELMQQQARQYPQSRQITVENPVEYPMDWAVQLPVTQSSGASFMDMVRMTLRMDPDIVLIGELRSADEAVAALQEAMTGHLVWTTLHVNDAFMTVDRLEMLDRSRLSREIVCDHKLIRGFVAQRLVSRLCPDCKQPLTSAVDDLPSDMADALKSWGDLGGMFVRGPGCPTCHGEQIMGASAVAEVVETTPELMRDYIKEGTDVARRNHRGRNGSDQSLLGNAMQLVLAGLVDPRDVESSVDLIVKKGEEN